MDAIKAPAINEKSSLIKFLYCSIFGIFTYFIPFQYRGVNSILIDHMANFIRTLLGSSVPIFCSILLIYGAIQPIIKRTWNADKGSVIFTVLKLLGIPLTIMYMFKLGPEYFLSANMLPFLFEKLVINITFLLPIGCALVIFLTDFGLMEFIGLLAQPFMRKIFKTSGRSAIDFVTSLGASCSVSLFITGTQYKKGHYTAKEAVIIATGLSTVSMPFFIITAKTLGLMHIWNFFFISTLFITVAATAISVRFFPIRKMSNKYKDGVVPIPEIKVQNSAIKSAIKAAILVSNTSNSLIKNMWANFLSGIKITMQLIPLVMSIGFSCLFLANYTLTFDILSYIIYPFTALLQFDDANFIAKVVSVGVVEMLLPASLVVDSNLITRYVVGVVSISQILFFSGSIPVIILNEIPVSIKDMLCIWFERVVISLLIATPLAWLYFR